MTTTTTTPSLVHTDPAAVVIDGNVRVADTDRPDFADLVESIKTHGVLTPCRGYLDAYGVVHITEGQRRTLAAAQAKATLPVYLAADAEAVEADRILAQLAENDHRAGVGTADRVSAYEQLALLGVSPAQIAKRTRRDRTEVDAALAVAKSEHVREHLQTQELTITQAAILAEFADDTDATERLEAVAAEEPDMLDHEAQALRDERARDAIVAEATERLIGEGFTPLTETYDYTKDASIDGLSRKGVTERERLSIQDEDVRACEGLRVRVRAVRTYKDGEPPLRADVDYVIVGYRTHGFMDRYGSSASTAGPMSEQEKAERKTVIENNKAWDSAETVRRDWLREFAGRKSAPKGAAEFIARHLLASIYDLHKQISDKHAALICDVLAIPETKTTGWHSRSADLREYLAKPNLAPGRATHLTLIMILVSIESGTGRHTWRQASSGDTGPSGDYLNALQGWGYTLSPVEQIAAGKKPRAKKASR